jgi:L-histidine N-alpha-methyltransferase
MMTETIPSKMIETGKRQSNNQFANDVLRGLSAPRKSLSSRYFYDEKGSRIFEEIMALPEYYLTNCEWEILKKHKQDILEYVIGQSFQLVDLGAGDAKKTKVLLEHFYDREALFSYIPIDINREVLEELEDSLGKEMPDLETIPVLAEYFDALKWLKETQNRKKLVLFLGSNIGNFAKKAATSFLTEMHNVLNNGDLLLIGIDLKKDPNRIIHAYSDSQGVTAAFNINLLRRINTELGGNFDLGKWTHFANYNPMNGAVKSYLVSCEAQDVLIQNLGKVFHFEAYEAIHTEYSNKYSPGEISALAANCGFEQVRVFMDKDSDFSDSLWRVVK